MPRRDDTSHRTVGHPLLATLGRDLRELQRSLPADPHTDEFVGGGDRTDTLLGWLQSDIAANAVRPQGRTLADDDRSVQVHSCHGPARQIDVLREVLLGLLADDPTLEPRDILVMCPDIETYAPLIVADFGLGDVVHGAHPAHRLRVRLADRSLIQTNPLLGVASQLLALAGSRVTASEVLNFAQAAPVRARFGFTDDDLESDHPLGPASPTSAGASTGNTAGRSVSTSSTTLGVSASTECWPVSRCPTTPTPGSTRRCRWTTSAATASSWPDSSPNSSTGCSGWSTRSPGRGRCGDWLAALTDGIALLARVDDNDAWQTSQMQREFADVLATAGPRTDTVLRLPDIRALLGRHLAGRPTRANFRTGTLTVCTMVPMRSVPHRVVCLVGLDDGVFPRLGVVDGDDALARNPMTGERDIRSEDRQLLLDAIGAATEKLVITYTGANEYSGQPRPPAVPLAELLDTLDMTTPEKVRDRIVCPASVAAVRHSQRHPGQAGAGHAVQL